MAKTRNMTGNQNLDSSSSSSRKRFKTCDNGTPPWSDVNNDVLFLVMKKLGFVDFVAFSGVCKSWREFAVSNKKMFMASLPPLSMKISTDANDEKDSYCKFMDFEGRKFKTVLPHYAGRSCVGVTCGYLILFGRETHDFWLVNPFTRHELHFPDFPCYAVNIHVMKAMVVFSPSISRWVFVVLHRRLHILTPGKPKLSYYIVGKQRWNHVSSTLPIVDLHFFKGKIYILHDDSSLGELRFNLMRKRKWTLHQTNNSSNLPNLDQPHLVSSTENLYLIYKNSEKVMELDFGEMKWVSPEKTIGEYAIFVSYCNNFVSAIKPLSWIGPQTKYKSWDCFFDTDKNQQCMFIYGWKWYSLHDCLNVNVLNG